MLSVSYQIPILSLLEDRNHWWPTTVHSGTCHTPCSLWCSRYLHTVYWLLGIFSLWSKAMTSAVRFISITSTFVGSVTTPWFFPRSLVFNSIGPILWCHSSPNLRFWIFMPTVVCIWFPDLLDFNPASPVDHDLCLRFYSKWLLTDVLDIMKMALQKSLD